MKNKIFAAALVLILAGFTLGQNLTPRLPETSYQTAAGVNYRYQVDMTDSTGTYYSSGINLSGYLPQDIYTNYIPCYVVGSGTADSVDIVVQTRMKIGTGTASTDFSTWTTVDSVKAQFNKVDGVAYYYPVNFNGGHPDQMRFMVKGMSTVNRSDVVITVIAVLTKQLPSAVFQIR